MITCVGALTLTVNDTEAPVGTTAALAICAGTWSQLRVETGGTGPPVGQASRNPIVVCPGPVIVKFKERARAERGMPQMPATG